MSNHEDMQSEIDQLTERLSELEIINGIIHERIDELEKAVSVLNVNTSGMAVIGCQPLDKTFHPGGMFNPDSAIKTTVGDL